MEPLQRVDVEQFRRLVATSLGLHFEDDRLDWLADILQQRFQQNGFPNAAQYLANLDPGGRQEWRALASQLTVVETYFFRAPEHFSALVNGVLPDRMAVLNGRRPLRMLSAGCASGEEAYSLAIAVREHFPQLRAEDVVITAFDLNPKMLEQAASARYTGWSLRGMPRALSERYFQQSGKRYSLRGDIRSMVRFEERNLAAPSEALWEVEQYDVIFCRNVLMYLTADAACASVARLRRALCSGGFLFLSPTETLRGVSHGFHLRHADDSFYYQKREGSAAATPVTAPKPVPAEALLDISWVEAVRQASERVASLSQDVVDHSAAATGACLTVKSKPGTPATSAGTLGPALKLLQAEKYREALHLLQGLPSRNGADADTQLLRAVVLTNCGEVSAAEAECRELLGRDELNAGAHYVSALCHEHMSDRQGAVEHDRAAIYLDPSFAMPHLHLGLLAKRMGDAHTARQEFGQAFTLLNREDSSRILLLGGGFSREVLLEFSRAQLCACGGRCE